MSNIDHQAQSEGKSAERASSAPAPGQSKPGLSPSILAIGGGVVAAAAVAGVLLLGGGQKAGTVDRPALTLVKKGEIEKAADTLAPEEKDKVVAEAKACTAPLASMRLSKTTSQGGGVVRIRAGNYLSPAFNVADTPINIAVPFPAPYETGKGEIVLEGPAKDVFVQLTPGLKMDQAAGALRIPVIWDTSKPCGG